MSPSIQEEEVSPSATRKDRVRPMVRRTRRNNIQRKVIPIPLVLETIPEVDEEYEEDEEENISFNQRTCVARVV